MDRMGDQANAGSCDKGNGRMQMNEKNMVSPCRMRPGKLSRGVNFAFYRLSRVGVNVGFKMNPMKN